MICPICKRHFEGEQLVCPHDNTPLVPEDGGLATRAETAELLSDETAATVRQTPVDGLRGLTAPVTAPMFAVGAGGPADESDVRLPAGRRVSEYEVTGVLGTGGMSTVYSGVHPVIGKRVAIKVMLSQYACDANRVARFVREARAVNQVDSDHIVDIFALGTLPDGRNYCVMEAIEGPSLRDMLKNGGRLPLGSCLPIFISVARALEAAHDVGVVHRDLKPSNIMVRTNREGETTAKVLDFGVAKLLDQAADSSFKTETGALIGTPHYMSPEQIRSGQVDHRADIYAFGLCLFRALTGRMPFEAADRYELFRQHLQSSPPNPSGFQKGIPRPAEELILRCLAKKPDQRPQSMAEVIGVLRAVEAQLPASAERAPPGPAYGSARLSPAEPGKPASSGFSKADLWIVCGVAAFGGAVLSAYLLWPRAKKRSSERQAEIVVDGGTKPRTIPPDAGSSTVRTAKLTITTGHPGARYTLDFKRVGTGKEVTVSGLKPGKHYLFVSAPGSEALIQKVVLKPGSWKRLVLTLHRGRSSHRRTTPGGRIGVRDGLTSPFGRGSQPASGKIWRDGPCVRKIPAGQDRFFLRKFGVAKLTGMRFDRNIYTPRHVRQRFGGKRSAITGCFRRYVRCKPEHWLAKWRVRVDATGRIRSVTYKAGKIPPQKFLECVVRLLKSARWGPTLTGQGGVFDMYISVRR